MSILSIVATVFVFSVLVLIHEFGHFLAARLMGVRVEKFSIGFPPTIFSKKIGGTEFAISAIPLGGFVKMAGFVDESLDTEITGADDEYSSKPVWKRMVIITAGVFMNLILAIIIYTAIVFTQGEQIIPTTTVTITHQSGIADKIGFQDGDKILAVNGFPISDWREIFDRFIDHVDNGVDFRIKRGKEELTLHYKKEWFSESKGEMLDIAPRLPARVGSVLSDMPAGSSGLKYGDMITALNNKPVKNWDDMTREIKASPGKTIPIQWQRGDSIYHSTITPAVENTTDTDGMEHTTGKIGIGPYIMHKSVSLSKALNFGLTQPFNVMYLNIKGLWWLISGVKKARDTIGGPIMIAQMAGQAARSGWLSIWGLIAALSSVLAFFNILPIPALDGGHFLLLLVEGLKGKPLSIKTRVIVQQVGIAVLLSFIVFVVFIDVSRLL